MFNYASVVAVDDRTMPADDRTIKFGHLAVLTLKLDSGVVNPVFIHQHLLNQVNRRVSLVQGRFIGQDVARQHPVAAAERPDVQIVDAVDVRNFHQVVQG